MTKLIQIILDHALDLKFLTGYRTNLIKAIMLSLAVYQSAATSTDVSKLLHLPAISTTLYIFLNGLLAERGLKFAAEHKA